MRDIYTWAQSLYVWLGEGTPSSDQAMDYLRRCGSMVEHLPVSLLAATTDEGRRREKARFWIQSYRLVACKFHLAGRPDSTSTNLPMCLGRVGFFFSWMGRNPFQADLDLFFRREWVRRAWTFQEIILASNPVILCGSRILTWAELLNAIYCREEPESKIFRWLLGGPGLAAHNNATRQWRAITDLWLELPRPLYWNGTMARPLGARIGELDPSFVERAKQWRGCRETELKLHVPLFLLRLAMLVGLLAPVGLAASLSLSSLGKWQIDHGVLGLIIFALLVGWILLAVAWGTVAAEVIGLLSAPRLRFLDGDNSTTLRIQELAVSGIHGALRNRVSTKPHDRSFSVYGVLASLGVSLPSPNYEQPAGEAFRLLLERLIMWKPACVAFIVDAGSQSTPGAPSWTPKWLEYRNTNSWLTSRYFAGRSHCPIPLRHGHGYAWGIPLVKAYGNKLIISGRQQGSVHFKASLARVNQPWPYFTGDIPQIKALCEWARHGTAYEQDRSSKTFAVLTGITPNWMPQDPSAAGEILPIMVDLKPAASEIIDSDGLHLRLTFHESEAQVHWPRVSASYAAVHPKRGLSFIDFDLFCQVFQQLNYGMPITEAVHYVCEYTGFLYYVHDLFFRLINEAVNEKRCLFSLTNGMLGTGPLEMETGDKIYLLRGVPTPMVLRETNVQGTFTVVGPALVEGVMNGESIRALSELVEVTLV